MSQFKIHYVDDVVLISLDNVPNNTDTLAKIFDHFGDAKINLDMISHTAHYKDTICLFFTVNGTDLSHVITVVGELKKLIPNMTTSVSPGNCKIVIYSELLKTECGIAAKLFNVINENNLHIRLITTSDVEISTLFEESELETAKKILTDAFIA